MALTCTLAGALGAAPAAFDLLPLGTYGGVHEGNMTCFAVRPVGAERYRMLLDAGSFSAVAEDAAGVVEFTLGLEDVFLTHSHLDHLSGLLIQLPNLFSGKAPPMRIHAPPETTKALAEDVFNDRLWGDFVAAGKVHLDGLQPEDRVDAGGFEVEAFRVDHTVPSYGYQVRIPGGPSMLFLADTGPTRGYLPRARALLKAGDLRALALECSFGSEKDALALATGHLTPRMIGEHLRELVDPAREGDRSPVGPDLPAMARALQGVKILIHHIKPLDEAVIRRELRGLREGGLDLVIPRQGQRLLF
jgi:cAMP phosphodiesterase